MVAVCLLVSNDVRYAMATSMATDYLKRDALDPVLVSVGRCTVYLLVYVKIWHIWLEVQRRWDWADVYAAKVPGAAGSTIILYLACCLACS